MDNNGILSMLGLALRAGRLVIGEEPVRAVVQTRDARLLLLASDAADNTRRQTERFAQTGQCIWLPLPFTRAELGQALGRTSVAIAALTDTGFASAIVRRLADVEPARYGEAAARLELKVRRAAERKNRPPEQIRPRRQTPADRCPPKQATAVSRKIRPEKPDPSGQSHRPLNTGQPDKRHKSGQLKKSGRSDKFEPSNQSNPSGRSAQKQSGRYAHSRPVKKGKGSFPRKG